MEHCDAAQTTARRPPAEYFTGQVWMEDARKDESAGGVNVVRVTFEPCARTAWHTHPLGQTLHVLTGVCWAGTWGGEVIELRAGDSVSFAPGEKHWHGAAPGTLMTHLAIQQSDGTTTTVWLEKVTDQEYRAGPASPG